MLTAALAIGMASLIAYLSLVPGDSKILAWMPPRIQKAGHLGCYAALGFLCSISLTPVLQPGWAQGAIAFVFTLSFGALMEWLQRGIPGRNPSFQDIMQDALGAIVGIAAAMLLHL